MPRGVKRGFPFAWRATCFVVAAILSVVAVIAFRAWTPHAGTLEEPENPYLSLIRVGLAILYPLLGWQCMIRRQSADRLAAWLILCVTTSLVWTALIFVNTATLNRWRERDSHQRSVLPRAYPWKAISGAGRLVSKQVYTATGIVFADEQNRGIERLPRPGSGVTAQSAACFTYHRGWLGGHWVSDMHDCDRPTEHIPLHQLRLSFGAAPAHPGLQCMDGDPADVLPGPPLDPRCPRIIDRQRHRLLVAPGTNPKTLTSLPLPDGYWTDPQVVAVSADGQRILVGDFMLKSRLFLWDSHLGQWAALQLQSFYRLKHHHYVLGSDADVVFDCPEGLQAECVRWATATPEARGH